MTYLIWIPSLSSFPSRESQHLLFFLSTFMRFSRLIRSCTTSQSHNIVSDMCLIDFEVGLSVSRNQYDTPSGITCLTGQVRGAPRKWTRKNESVDHIGRKGKQLNKYKMHVNVFLMTELGPWSILCCWRLFSCAVCVYGIRPVARFLAFCSRRSLEKP